MNAFKRKLLAALHEKDADFELYLLANVEMNRVRRALLARRDFRGAEARKIAREEMVDVLSFPEPKGFPHPDSRKRRLGEVYLNLDAARPKSLVVHGVLHLLGYRHDRLRDTIKMKALEEKLCKKLKILSSS